MLMVVVVLVGLARFGSLVQFHWLYGRGFLGQTRGYFNLLCDTFFHNYHPCFLGCSGLFVQFSCHSFFCLFCLVRDHPYIVALSTQDTVVKAIAVPWFAATMAAALCQGVLLVTVGLGARQ